MTFKEEMNERGYEIRERSNEKLAIIHRGAVANAVIIFDHTCKKMVGFICQSDIYMDIDDITRMYGLFNQMKEDVACFSELSGYEVIR